MRDRLIELLQNFADGTVTGNGTIVDGTKVDDVADYLLANGVIVPPCKVGDTVYDLHGQKIEVKGCGIDLVYKAEICFDSESPYPPFMQRKTRLPFAFKGCAFGETVFLTREEAEAKLKGGGE